MTGGIGNERGAALIVAILVMLVLSAMGMVAVRASMESVWTSASHRMASQANSFSDATVQYGMMRSGRNAATVYEFLRRRSDFDMGQATNDDAAELRRGGYVIYIKGEAEDGQVSMDDFLAGGRLLESDVVTGLESELDVAFRFIVRDPIVGPPAPGFGENYCFNRVTIASEAVVGTEEGRRRQRAMGRHASEAFIGPVECGTQF